MKKSATEGVLEKLFSQKAHSERFNGELKEKILKMKEEGLKKLQNVSFAGAEEISPEEEAKIAELADYIEKYVRETGKKQAIIDFQTGLNLLNGYKKESAIKSLIRIEEDGDFGEKTLAALLGALKYYPVSTIARFIRLGAINNNLWRTKSLAGVNTDEEIANITKKFNERN